MMSLMDSASFKISIIGAGNVGATTAYALLLRGVPSEVALIDIDRKKAEGIVLDMEHSLSFTAYAQLKGTDDLAACKDSHLVIITAGKKQSEGQTRLELAKANKKIIEEIMPRVAKIAPSSLILVVTNPVDVLAYTALKISGFAARRVFGSGTILDTARFQFHLSEKLGIHPQSIDAYILGEHGDSSFPALSCATVAGKKLMEMPNFTLRDAEACYEKTRTAAYRIIHDVGYTCYSIATAVSELARAIKEDSHRIFMLSTLLENYYGHSNVCLSMPCVVGRNGIEKIIEIPLDEAEQEKLAKSVETVKEFL